MQIRLSDGEMDDSEHSIAEGASELAEKCWVLGVRFLRDSDFAAELSLYYERRAPKKGCAR
jgi:hypothetical protein